MKRKVSIFGSTGSVGQNTVSLLQAQGGPDAYDVVGVSGARNIELLADQARALNARMAVTADPALYDDLKKALQGTDIRPAAGPDALIDMAAEPVDWTMSAIVGAAGLEPGIRSAEHGGTIALANKESLVCAGDLFLQTCKAHETHLIPVDSEHSAIFQALRGESHGDVERIILTASGGPFRAWSQEQMAQVTPAQARAHPNWDMGERISIDSASMFNKAMELIEAKMLFDLAPDQVEAVVHPQSVIHSMVGFKDGAIMANLGPSDMRGAIGYALNWPDRRDLPVERLDFTTLSRLDFEPVDPGRFPALRLARETMEIGGLAGTVFNAAKEIALDGFLSNAIGFLDMAALVEHVMNELGPDACSAGTEYNLTDVLDLNDTARKVGRTWLNGH